MIALIKVLLCRHSTVTGMGEPQPNIMSRRKGSTEREDRAIVRSAVTTPDSSLTFIQRVTWTPVTARLRQRSLRKQDLNSRRPLPGLPLSYAHL